MNARMSLVWFWIASFCLLVGCSEKKQIDYSLRQNETQSDFDSIAIPLIGPFECTEHGIPTKRFMPELFEIGSTVPVGKPFFINGSFESEGGKSAPVYVMLRVYQVGKRNEIKKQVAVHAGDTKFPKPKQLADNCTFSFKNVPIKKRGKYMVNLVCPADESIQYGKAIFEVK